MKSCGRPCSVCGGSEAEILHSQAFSLPLGHPLQDGYDVVACAGCGFVYADTSVPQAAYDRFYEQLSKYTDPKTSTGSGADSIDSLRLRQTAELIAKLEPDRDASVLDIGCAGGGMLHALSEFGYRRLCGMDPAPGCVEAVRQKGFEGFTGSFETLKSSGQRQFDAIVLSHVLEHVRDLAGAVEAVTAVSSSRAMIYVEVPDPLRYADFNYAPLQEFNTEHINHFGQSHLVSLFARAGWTASDSRDRTLPLAAGSYPAIYVCFRRGASEPPAGFDPSVRDSLLRYIDESNKKMAALESNLEEALQGRQEVILWGAGQLSFKLLRGRALSKRTVTACVDSNPLYQGQSFAQAEIIAPTQLRDAGTPIVITTILHEQSVIQSIRKLGLRNPVVTLTASSLNFA